AQRQLLAREERRERLTLDELHRVVGQVAREPRLEDADDVRMVEARGRLGLADEPLDERRAAGLAQDLERAELARGVAARLEDDPHAAAADLLEQRVGAELAVRDEDRAARA